MGGANQIKIVDAESKYTDHRDLGYYWVVKDGVFHIGKWNGEYWKLHDDQHQYNDLELMAILPSRIVFNHYEMVYGWQLQAFNSDQMRFLFSEPIKKNIEFTSDEVEELIYILTNKRWQK